MRILSNDEINRKQAFIEKKLAELERAKQNSIIGNNKEFELKAFILGKHLLEAVNSEPKTYEPVFKEIVLYLEKVLTKSRERKLFGLPAIEKHEAKLTDNTIIEVDAVATEAVTPERSAKIFGQEAEENPFVEKKKKLGRPSNKDKEASIIAQSSGGNVDG